MQVAATQDVDAGQDEKPEVNPNAQGGIKSAKAMTMTWGKTGLIVFYGCDFEAQSLIPAIFIVSNFMASTTLPLVAKLPDVWGPPVGAHPYGNLSGYLHVLRRAGLLFHRMVGLTYSMDVMTPTTHCKDRGVAFA
ncbi:uncharacterized protein BCR38DRAFT_528370 [Pseudomassariella vexata]|uniref:Uncharacterized protein n=1 Tax=Pseudomassariella vexata TaxID=1141098 RepID=A0A1Y2DCK1_9PEZI|nr:uncharacterized protein BCR38DRAFT_528370 [Pseudomassariella vexata]ORY57000.1 hypothetical protein BCR38DRAFT_528370 [Pseudomassariella vexata]